MSNNRFFISNVLIIIFLQLLMTNADTSLHREYDVEVGPIWNQAHAIQVAKEYIENHPLLQWTGRWRTTNYDRMSVLGIREYSLKQSRIIIPGGQMGNRRFPNGNEEYNFWRNILQFLQGLNAVRGGAYGQFLHEANVAVNGMLTNAQWRRIFGGHVSSYTAALNHILSRIRNLPPGTRIPAAIIRHLHDVLRIRHHHIQTAPQPDPNHVHTFNRWLAIGSAIAGAVVTGALALAAPESIPLLVAMDAEYGWGLAGALAVLPKG